MSMSLKDKALFNKILTSYEPYKKLRNMVTNTQEFYRHQLIHAFNQLKWNWTHSDLDFSDVDYRQYYNNLLKFHRKFPNILESWSKLIVKDILHSDIFLPMPYQIMDILEYDIDNTLSLIFIENTYFLKHCNDIIPGSDFIIENFIMDIVIEQWNVPYSYGDTKFSINKPTLRKILNAVKPHINCIVKISKLDWNFSNLTIEFIPLDPLHELSRISLPVSYICSLNK